MPGPVLDSLAGEFEEFDSTVIGDQTQQRLRELAATLIAAFPPDTSALNA